MPIEEAVLYLARASPGIIVKKVIINATKPACKYESIEIESLDYLSA
jgi:hypothetical protein